MKLIESWVNRSSMDPSKYVFCVAFEYSDGEHIIFVPKNRQSYTTVHDAEADLQKFEDEWSSRCATVKAIRENQAC